MRFSIFLDVVGRYSFICFKMFILHILLFQLVFLIYQFMIGVNWRRNFDVSWKFLKGIWFFFIFGTDILKCFHHRIPPWICFILINQVTKIDCKDLHDNKPNKFLPTENNRPIWDKTNQHIPQCDRDCKNIPIKLLLVVNNHVPNICTQNYKHTNQQSRLNSIHLEILKRMLQTQDIDHKEKEHNQQLSW